MPLWLLSGANGGLPYVLYPLFIPDIAEFLKVDMKELQRNTVSKKKICCRARSFIIPLSKTLVIWGNYVLLSLRTISLND